MRATGCNIRKTAFCLPQYDFFVILKIHSKIYIYIIFEQEFNKIIILKNDYKFMKYIGMLTYQDYKVYRYARLLKL